MIQAMPMPGGPKMKVYSREELMEKTMKGMKEPGEGGDDDDDDEDEEDDVPVRVTSFSICDMEECFPVFFGYFMGGWNLLCLINLISSSVFNVGMNM